jgi:hypothetical protein
MSAGGGEDPPRVRSWITPKAVKGGASGIEGMGVHAIEELTLDYATFLTDPGFTMECHCRAIACRATVTGIDWMRADVQERYRGWFSWWLEQKITATRGCAG